MWLLEFHARSWERRNPHLGDFGFAGEFGVAGRAGCCRGRCVMSHAYGPDAIPMKYEVLAKKGEGSFSEVVTVQLEDGRMAAIKRMKTKFSSWDEVRQLREVQALERVKGHPNCITLLRRELVSRARAPGAGRGSRPAGWQPGSRACRWLPLFFCAARAAAYHPPHSPPLLAAANGPAADTALALWPVASLCSDVQTRRLDLVCELMEMNIYERIKGMSSRCLLRFLVCVGVCSRA